MKLWKDYEDLEEDDNGKDGENGFSPYLRSN